MKMVAIGCTNCIFEIGEELGIVFQVGQDQCQLGAGHDWCKRVAGKI